MTVQGGADGWGPPEGWGVANLIQYWSPETSAVEQFSHRLAQLGAAQRTSALAVLQESVENQTSSLEDRALAELATSAIDNL